MKELPENVRERLKKMAQESFVQCCPEYSSLEDREEYVKSASAVNFEMAAKCPLCGNQESFYCVRVTSWVEDIKLRDRYQFFFHFCDKCNHTDHALDMDIDVSDDQFKYGCDPSCPLKGHR